MSLKGLPDFQRPIQAEGLHIFYPYEGGDGHTLIPDRLEVAELDGARPDLRLEMVRGQNPMLPPAPYGVLDFRVRPRYRTEEALQVLRDLVQGAVLSQALFSGGFLRLQPAADVAEGLQAELLKPTRLAWNGLGDARFIMKLTASAVTLLKRALEDETMLLSSAAELEMIGVAPRLPVRLRFNPSSLLNGLLSLADDRRLVARDDLLSFFRKGPRFLPVEVIGEIDDQRMGEFAEAMADMVRLRFATFAPCPHDDVKAHLALVSAEEVGSGSFEWDLSEPVQVPRPLVLELDPMQAARKLVREQGLGTVFHETVVPPISTGFHQVAVSANLPSPRLGILALGVTVRVPPRMPFRPQAVIGSVELDSPETTRVISLRLSPAEKLEYLFSTFVVVRDSGGIEQLKAEEAPHSGDRLNLSPDDFPVDFIPVGASHALLEVADIRGVCRRPEGGSEVRQEFRLNLDQQSVTLALPRGTEGATLEIEATPRGGLKSLKLGPSPARAIQLGLNSFREYGPQKVEVECAFGDQAGLVAIEFLPEGRAETTEEISLLLLTPAQPRKEWSYLARSPFQAGYRYRLQKRADEPPAEWSEVRSPFERLQLEAPAKSGGQ